MGDADGFPVSDAVEGDAVCRWLAYDADGNLTTVSDQYFSYHDPILSAELQGPLQQLVAKRGETLSGYTN